MQAIQSFPFIHIILQHHFQNTFLCKVGPVEIYMKYRVYIPFRFQLLHGQSLEQLPAPQVIVLQGRDQQTLAEPPGTAQEIDVTFVGQIINHRGLVYIDETAFDDTLETLYADRKLHVANE